LAGIRGRVVGTAIVVSLAGNVLAGCSTANSIPLRVDQDTVPLALDNAPEGSVWLVPSALPGTEMKVRVFRPPGTGPFSLAVINHGSQQDPPGRQGAKPPEFAALTNWFLQRGYVVVLPERPGHGDGGKYLEDQGGCADANFEQAAQGTAASIEAAVEYMRKQSFISSEGIIVAGHSAGAWGSLAYAARRPPGVAAVINFSGGRGGHHLNRPNNNCAPERLVATAGIFGRTTKIPTLWLYAENDTYFPPPLSEAMAKAFAEAGGRADFRLLPPTGKEGHFLIRSDTWKPALQQFLDTTR
jgi:dienelactone hydrolase